MKMIPSHIWKTDSTERGEAQIFRLLEQINLSRACIGMHSLNLHGGNKQRWHELDFIVISQRAIIGIEVKAGKVSCSEGIWYVHNRDGSVAYKKFKSPLVQASEAVDRLRTGWLRNHFGKQFDSLPFVKVAVLCGNHRPDPQVKPMGPELLDQLTLYMEDLYPEEFKKRLNQAIDYEVANSPRNTSRQLTQPECEDIAWALRPDLDVSYPSHAAMEYTQRKQEELTEEQYRFADMIDAAFRYMMDGGAGTGKTFLLQYDAQRRSSRGEKVGVLVPTPELCQHLRNRLGAGVLCFTPGDAPGEDVAFDALYVDEAQDFVNEEGLFLMDRLVKGGMDKGTWRIYGDFKNQLSPGQQQDKSVWELLVEYTGNSSVLPLSRNVRNTPQIVNWLEKTCGARIGETESLGAGPEVEVVEEAQLLSYLSGNEHHDVYGQIDKGDVVILHPEEFEQSLIQSRPISRKPQCTVSTIEHFRGLESPVVFILGLDSINDQARLKDQCYKAVSRARSLCFIAGNEQLLGRFIKLTRSCRGQ